MACRSFRWLLVLPLTGLTGPPARPARLLEISPETIPVRGGALRVWLPTGAADATPAEAPSIGLAFGRLVRVRASTVESAHGLRLCVDLPALDRLFRPTPKVGDELMLVVYAGERPLTAARPVTVAASASRGRCATFPSPEPHLGARQP